ncbi:MAG TPA: FtsX-like permease family protein [Thermoanaerobaculaceae bacterium]|nr:FtsX-like permease family protein [Thermoanaerobaculaceae bacterium]
MKLALFLAGRLLRRRGTALLRTSALAALLAVALGAASLVVVLALMSGYTGALRSGVLAAGGHLVALLPPGLSHEQAVKAETMVAAVPGVAGVGEVVYLPGMLFPRAGGDAELVSVRAGSRPAPFVHLPASGTTGPLELAVGRGVARRLALSPGDTLTLQVVAGGTPRAVAVRVGQVFSTGFSELDERFVITDLAALRGRVPTIAGGGLEVWLTDPERANALRDRVEEACGRGALVATWQERNRNLFAALRWQKISLGLVLSLVLGVGAFEVASALVVLVTEKRRELGVLLALGGQPRLLRRTLLVAGAALGAAGVLAGMLLGVALVLLLSLLGVPHFPPDIASIYMVERIPLRLLPGDLAAVLALSLVEVVLAALLPARRTSRREPVEVLRWV